MNCSIRSASAHTHLKIFAIALLAALAVIWVGLAAHTSSAPRDVSVPSSILSP